MYLRHEGVFEGQVISSVDQQLILEVLRWVEIFAGRLLSITSTLNRIVASSDPPILDFYVDGRVGKFALGVWTRTFVPLELAAHFQLEPSRVFDVEYVVEVEHLHVLHARIDHGVVGGGGGGGGRGIQNGGRTRTQRGRGQLRKRERGQDGAKLLR